MVLDVTVGSIKYGSDLQTPSYYPSGGYMMPHQGQIFSFGLTLPKNQPSGLSALAAESQPDVKQLDFGHVTHKKTLHLYRPEETKWVEATD